MIDFVKELAACRVEGTQLPFYPERVQGYTEQEVELIAEYCNLSIHGQFREFLLQMGRCSGGYYGVMNSICMIIDVKNIFSIL